MDSLTANPFPREELRDAIAQLAGEGIYVGTSSWKYPGWLGLLYTPERYRTRGKLSRAKFEKTCLYEYAKVFKTVCLDGGLYQFPTSKMLEPIFAQVPTDFQLSLKVTEDITVKKFPDLPRYGKRAGKTNEHFLDADLFIASYLGPLEPHREQIGAIIFEFSHIRSGDWSRGRDFVAALDAFLDRLPRGWNYSVEVRNESLLQPEYFAVLRKHGIAHTLNNWSRMPSVLAQMEIPHSITADFLTARFLLKPGRTYEQAVEKFEPYTEVREPNPDVRLALLKLLTAPAGPDHPRRRFLYVNNRIEGCALWTIYAVISGLVTKAAARNPLSPTTDEKTANILGEIS
jgi:uncharacterized protein YecE (DUF72 family)